MVEGRAERARGSVSAALDERLRERVEASEVLLKSLVGKMIKIVMEIQ